MSRRKQVTYWACDFETTAWGHKLEEEKGRFQDKTEVWGAADVALYDETETVTITHSIRDFIYRFCGWMATTFFTSTIFRLMEAL